MMHSAISPEDVADRLAIRDLIDAYAHWADRGDAKGQRAPFIEDAVFHIFMDSRLLEASYLEGTRWHPCSYDDIVDHCCCAWSKLIDLPWRIMTLGLRDWTHPS